MMKIIEDSFSLKKMPESFLFMKASQAMIDDL